LRPARLNGGIILEGNNYSGKVSVRPKSASGAGFGLRTVRKPTTIQVKPWLQDNNLTLENRAIG
jgi:hypothetical protein